MPFNLLCVCSVMSNFLRPHSEAHQVPLSMEFSRQEYWSGLSFPNSGDLPNTRMEPVSPAFAGKFLTTESPAAAAKSLQSCPTLSYPMDCSPPGSSVHEIFQARILEWVAVSFPMASA